MGRGVVYIVQLVCLVALVHVALVGRKGSSKVAPSDANHGHRQALETHHEIVINNEHPFHILCTTHSKIMKWGSYRIRCRDFQNIVHHCAPSAQVFLAAHQEFGNNNTSLNFNRTPEELDIIENRQFDATISIKRNFKPEPRFGKVFIDMLDEYQPHHHHDALSEGVEMLVQNEQHGQDLFPERRSHVVHHWYNSFLADTLESKEVPPFPLPQIKPLQKYEQLKMVTIWNSPKTKCPVLTSNSSTTYDCINESVGIGSWYEKYMTGGEQEHHRLANLLKDPLQGTGRLYDEVFWQYHVAVVPTKTCSKPKLKYGSMQRALSQMRSGVPVLLEVHGPVRHAFVEKYGYSCVFTSDPNFEDEFPTFEQAVEQMRSPQKRQKCQQEGLTISHQYSPATIVEQELRLLGYTGNFACGKASTKGITIEKMTNVANEEITQAA